MSLQQINYNYAMHINNNLADNFKMVETIMWIKMIKAVLAGNWEGYIT